MDKDLIIVDALSIALMITIFSAPLSPLRIILGLPFVLLFPGYALINALFPKKNDLDILERSALSIGLSIAIVPLVGLALNYSPWGIRLLPIMASLFTFTLLMSAITRYRRSKLSVDQRLKFSLSVKIPSWNAIRKADKLFVIGFLVSIMVVGSLMVYLVSTPQTGQQFTEFYVLGSNGQLSDYPTNLTIGENATLALCIVNHESENVTYHIVITLNNSTIETINNITLSNGETWDQNYTLTPTKTGDNMNLSFLLYREGLDTPYRSLQLWINVQ